MLNCCLQKYLVFQGSIRKKKHIDDCPHTQICVKHRWAPPGYMEQVLSPPRGKGGLGTSLLPHL